MKEDHVSCLFKDVRINKVFWKYNQTITNWKDFVFHCRLWVLLFSACRHLRHYYFS